MIGEYLSFAGPQIMLPNLEFLELDSVGITRPDEPKKFDLKSTKIECFKITGCTGLPGKEFPEIFVKAQEKNLKKLTGSECGFSF
jgi:hypothetical protein